MIPEERFVSVLSSKDGAREESGTAAKPAPDASAPLRAYLEETLAQLIAAPNRTGIHLVTVPAPAGDIESLLGTLPDDPAILWDPPRGNGRQSDTLIAGLGFAATIEPRGTDRLDVLRESGSTIFSAIRGHNHPDHVSLANSFAQTPRLFGGLSFAIGGGDDTPWRPFSDGAFTLPRWTYERNGRGASLTLAIDLRGAGVNTAAPTHPPLSKLLDEYDGIIRTLEVPAIDSPNSPTVCAAPLDQVSELRWTELVESIRDGIASGQFEKIVAARRSVARLENEIDVAHLLRRLGGAYPGCYRFAFRRGDATFVGATPERLVRKQRDRIWTEALAGSIGSPRSSNAAERSALGEQLLASNKDLGEHALVVDSLRRRLAPLCRELSIPDEPTTLELRGVTHLHSPIEGTLADPSHILDLVAVLHPTPSVGGVPTNDAIEWITKHEPDPRGWYAGPIGWFDESGDGEFAVALRCGLIEGRQAHVFAGAGIVRDSDPSKEYAETDIKQQALLRALGVDT